jgi:Flp pilus assembly protein TadD
MFFRPAILRGHPMPRFRRQLAMLLAAMTACLSGCAALQLGALSSLTPPDDLVGKKLAFARICEHHGEPDQARLVYESILDKEPTNQVAEHRLGVLAAKRGDQDESIRRLLKAREMGEPTGELLNDLGYAYYLQDQLDLAETALREALDVAPHFTPAWTNLGLVLGDRGRFSESFTAFSHAGSPAEAHCSLGYVYAQHGKFREAQAEFEQALSLDGNLHPATEGLLQVCSRITGQEPVSVVLSSARKRVSNSLPTTRAPGAEPPAADGAAGTAQNANQAAVPFSWPSDATRFETPTSGAAK